MKKNIHIVPFIAILTLLLLSSCEVAGNIELTNTPQIFPTTFSSVTPEQQPSFTKAAALTSTSAPTATKAPTLVPSLTSAPVHYGPGKFPKNVNPLTGLIVSDPTILDRRPLMIKVSNFPAFGRPQSGLSFADIVFETYIGEGTNRFSAIFYGQNPEKVGPVRSARLADPQLASMYQSVLGFQSADARVYVKIIQDLGIRAISGSSLTCPALCNNDPNSIVGVYAEPKKLTDFAVQKGVYNARKPLDGMVFNSAPPEDSDNPAETVTIKYNDWDIGEWRYDASTNMYLRWEENLSSDNVVTMVPLTDKLTGKQLAFANVLILFAHYNEYNPTLHNIELLSNRKGMRAVLFRDGVAYAGYWVSPATEQPIQFYFLNGTPLALKPGNSWMVITGSSSELNYSEEGKWLMQFSLP